MSSPTDPLAAVLAEAEANRRRDRAAASAAGSVSIPAVTGNYTTIGNVSAGNPVTLDENAKVDESQLYPAAAGQTGITFNFEQDTPQPVWTVKHNLNGYPVVVVRNAAGDQIIPEIDAIDMNTTRITFGRPTAGSASLSL